jgi:hypothetical protein
MPWKIAAKSSPRFIRPPMSRRLFAVQSSVGLEHGIRSLATDPTYILVKLINDARYRQTVEPLAQQPLIVLPGISFGNVRALNSNNAASNLRRSFGPRSAFGARSV